MRPKTKESPAANRNSNIPKEIPLRLCTIQNSIAASPPLFAKGPLERDQSGSLQILFGGHPQELIHRRNGLDDHRHNLVPHLFDSVDGDTRNHVLIPVKPNMPAGRLHIHLTERLQKLGLILDVSPGGFESLVN